MPTDQRQTVDLDDHDVAARIVALGDADPLRLEALARLRARGLPGVGWADVFNEAVLRLLSGSRSCPADVPLVAVLALAMRGVADDHWRRIRRERPVLVRTIDRPDDPARRQADPSPEADPERVTAAALALASLDRLFARDWTVLVIIAGLAEGRSAEEIRSRHGLSETQYDTARRRMRRALLRHDREDGEP